MFFQVTANPFTSATVVSATSPIRFATIPSSGHLQVAKPAAILANSSKLFHPLSLPNPVEHPQTAFSLCPPPALSVSREGCSSSATSVLNPISSPYFNPATLCFPCNLPFSIKVSPVCRPATTTPA